MKFRCFLKAVYRFALFFLVVSFIASCCITLFVYTLSQSVGFALTDENIHAAAKITMLNVLLLSLILTIADSLRRKITVERPAQAIIDAGHKLMAGDFSVRISKAKTFDPDNRFGEIGECFNRMAQELSATETLRTDFVSNVSHELKTPLAVMQNYATLLQTPGLPEEKRLEYANAISDASRRLAALAAEAAKPGFADNAQTFKRVANILRKQGAGATGAFRAELLAEEPEKALAAALTEMAAKFDALWAEDRFDELLALMDGVRPTVDAFFDGVMVMAEDAEVRANRLDLLQALLNKMGRLADFSALQM